MILHWKLINKSISQDLPVELVAWACEHVVNFSPSSSVSQLATHVWAWDSLLWDWGAEALAGPDCFLIQLANRENLEAWLVYIPNTFGLDILNKHGKLPLIENERTMQLTLYLFSAGIYIKDDFMHLTNTSLVYLCILMIWGSWTRFIDNLTSSSLRMKVLITQCHV